MAYLKLENITFAYNNGPVLKSIDLAVEKGEMMGLIGPNGSGKTTLLKLISGVLRPEQGEIFFNSTKLEAMSRKAIAQLIAVVPQDYDIPFSYSVREIVELGRTPFHSFFDGAKGEDESVARTALELTGTGPLAEKCWNELSGGEKQKVVLAAALAQEPELLLLDEPTVHLDIANQIEILERIKALNRQSGLTIIAAMHDLNLAAMYFERLVLLKQGEIIADGTPSNVITESNIYEAFSTGVRVKRDPATGAPYLFVLRQSVSNVSKTGQDEIERL